MYIIHKSRNRKQSPHSNRVLLDATQGKGRDNCGHRSQYYAEETEKTMKRFLSELLILLIHTVIQTAHLTMRIQTMSASHCLSVNMPIPKASSIHLSTLEPISLKSNLTLFSHILLGAFISLHNEF